MNPTLKVSLQGISSDLTTATGSYDVTEAGEMDRAQLKELLEIVIQIPVPEANPDEDRCPPHILAEGPAGLFSFASDYGSYFCNEAQTDVDPEAAVQLAFGEKTPEDLGGEDVRVPPAGSESASSGASPSAGLPKVRRNVGLSLLFFAGMAIMLLGVLGQILMLLEGDSEGGIAPLLFTIVLTVICFLAGRYFWGHKEVVPVGLAAAGGVPLNVDRYDGVGEIPEDEETD